MALVLPSYPGFESASLIQPSHLSNTTSYYLQSPVVPSWDYRKPSHTPSLLNYTISSGQPPLSHIIVSPSVEPQRSPPPSRPPEVACDDDYNEEPYEDEEEEAVAVDDEDEDFEVIEIDDEDDEPPWDPWEEDPVQEVPPRSSKSFRPDTATSPFPDTDSQALVHYNPPDTSAPIESLAPSPSVPPLASPESDASPPEKPPSSLVKAAKGMSDIVISAGSLLGTVAAATLSSAANIVSSIGDYANAHGKEFGDALANAIHQAGNQTATILTDGGEAAAKLAGATLHVGLGAGAGVASWTAEHGPDMTKKTAKWFEKTPEPPEPPPLAVLESRGSYLKRKFGLGGTPPGSYRTSDGREVVIKSRGSDGSRRMRTTEGEIIDVLPSSTTTPPAPRSASQRSTTPTPSVSSQSGGSRRRNKSLFRRSRSKSKDSQSKSSKPRSRKGSKDSSGKGKSNRSWSGGKRRASDSRASSDEPGVT